MRSGQRTYEWDKEIRRKGGEGRKGEKEIGVSLIREEKQRKRKIRDHGSIYDGKKKRREIKAEA